MKFNLQYFAENEEVETTASEVETETEQQTLTQEEVNRLIAQNKSKAKSEAEKELLKSLGYDNVDEAKAIIEQAKEIQNANMSVTERQEAELKAAQEALAEYKRKEKLSERSKQASKVLEGEGIQPSENLLNMLVNEDETVTHENAVALANEINRLTELNLKKALSGETPTKFNNGGKAWTKDEIMDIKDANERQRLIQENRQLFN